MFGDIVERITSVIYLMNYIKGTKNHMIQEFDLSNIVSSYSLHDCYIEDMEYKDGLLKFYIDEILPETKEGYDDPEDFSNKYKSLIVTYKINDNVWHSLVNIIKLRYIFSFSYHKNKTVELKDYVAYFKKIKKKEKIKVEIYHQYFTNLRCLVEIEHDSMPNYGSDFCTLHLNADSITYEWREKTLEQIVHPS